MHKQWRWSGSSAPRRGFQAAETIGKKAAPSLQLDYPPHFLAPTESQHMAHKKSGAARALKERDHRKHAAHRPDRKSAPAHKAKGKAKTPAAKVRRGEKERAPKQAKKGAAKGSNEEGEGEELEGEEPEAAEAAPAEASDDDETPAAEDLDDDEDDDLAPAKKGGKATDRKEVKDLLALGRDKGFLTYDEVNDALPSDIVSSDQIDDVMSMFGDNDIAIVDEANKVKLPETKPPEPEPVHAKAAEEEAEEKKEQEEEDNYSKSNDPVRMYLRKMGSVSLLTREGEVEIAKRTDDGEKEVLAAVLHSSIAIKEIIQIGDRLRKGKMRVREVIRDAPDEDDETFDEQGRADQVVKLIDKIRRLDRDNEKLHEQLDSKTKKLSVGKAKEIREEVLRHE